MCRQEPPLVESGGGEVHGRVEGWLEREEQDGGRLESTVQCSLSFPLDFSPGHFPEVE